MKIKSELTDKLLTTNISTRKNAKKLFWTSYGFDKFTYAPNYTFVWGIARISFFGLEWAARVQDISMLEKSKLTNENSLSKKWENGKLFKFAEIKRSTQA